MNKALRWWVLTAVMIAIVGIITTKAVEDGWFEVKEPLDLSDAPVLLFFNRHKGCECELVVYTAAEDQVNAWVVENNNSVQIIRIDLDRRPDLKKQYGIVRAPALFLVDDTGAVIVGQIESLSDSAPFDIELFDKAIKEIKNGS